jgi:hypothetical protein
LNLFIKDFLAFESASSKGFGLLKQTLNLKHTHKTQMGYSNEISGIAYCLNLLLALLQ